MKYYLKYLKATVREIKEDNAGLYEVVTSKSSFLRHKVCNNCKKQIPPNTTALRWWLRPNLQKFHEKYFCKKCYRAIQDPQDEPSKETVKTFTFSTEVL